MALKGITKVPEGETVIDNAVDVNGSASEVDAAAIETTEENTDASLGLEAEAANALLLLG